MEQPGPMVTLRLLVHTNQCKGGVHCTVETYHSHAYNQLWYTWREGPVEVGWPGEITMLLADDGQLDSVLIYKLRVTQNTAACYMAYPYSSIFELLKALPSSFMREWFPKEILRSIRNYLNKREVVIHAALMNVTPLIDVLCDIIVGYSSIESPLETEMDKMD